MKLHPVQSRAAKSEAGGPKLGTGLLLAAVGVLFSTSGCGFERIPVASVGVKFNANSGLSHKILRPEVVWVNPFTERLIIYPTGIINATFVKNESEGDRRGDDSIKATTVEGAILPIDVTVAYRIPGDEQSVQRVFESFGTMELREIQTEHVRWATIVSVNEVTGQRPAFDLLSRERARLGPDIKGVLGPLLEPWGLVVEDVLVREIHPPEEIVKKISDQQATRTELDNSRVKLQQARIEAQTRLTDAQKTAEQNRLLSQQGDKSLQLRRLELRKRAILKWDGQSPLIGTNSIPFTSGGF